MNYEYSELNSYPSDFDLWLKKIEGSLTVEDFEFICNMRQMIEDYSNDIQVANELLQTTQQAYQEQGQALSDLSQAYMQKSWQMAMAIGYSGASTLAFLATVLMLILEIAIR